MNRLSSVKLMNISKLITTTTLSSTSPDVLWYTFEAADFSGLNIKNHVTNDYLATCSTSGMLNTSTFATGASCLYMNGSSYVSLSSTITGMTTFSATQSQSHCLWIYCTSATASSSGYMAPFVYLYNGQYTHTTLLIANNGGNNMCISRFNYGGQYWAAAANSFAINTWNHIAVTATNTSSGNWTLNAYLNGALLNTLTSFNSLVDGGGPSYIGSGNLNAVNGMSGNSNFIGCVDDLRIYNRALSASEVLSIYNKTA